MVQTAIKLDIFDRKMYERYFILTSEGIKRRAEAVTEKREKMRELYEKQHPISSPISDAETHPETRQSKEKKSIEKNIDRARPQSLEEIKILFKQREYFDAENQAEKFFNHYTANGWRVGRNPMKDWRAAAANWNKNSKEWSGNKKTSAQVQGVSRFPCPRGCGQLLTEQGKEAHLMYQCPKTAHTH